MLPRGAPSFSWPQQGALWVFHPSPGPKNAPPGCHILSVLMMDCGCFPRGPVLFPAPAMHSLGAPSFSWPQGCTPRVPHPSPSADDGLWVLPQGPHPFPSPRDASPGCHILLPVAMMGSGCIPCMPHPSPRHGHAPLGCFILLPVVKMGSGCAPRMPCPSIPRDVPPGCSVPLSVTMMGSGHISRVPHPSPRHRGVTPGCPVLLPVT